MYTNYFGFSEEPFSVTPDPKFLYLSVKHQEALAAMVYGIKAKKGFISIVGEVGTGKTTLLRSLLDDLDEKIETVLIFNTTANFEQLLKYIMLDLNIPTNSEGKLELIFKLNRFLIDKIASGTTVALIVDEAQNLSSQVLEELRLLSNLETAKEKLLQIVLVGQPEFHAKLSSPDLRQLNNRIVINRYLAPLQAEEIKEYIAHRLSIAGCQDDHIFSKKALELICKHSRGIPRTINILCDNALLSTYSKDLKRVNADIAEEVITDYKRSKIPLNEKVPSVNPVHEEHERLNTSPLEKKPRPHLLMVFTKSRIAIVSLIFVIAIFSTLRLSAYVGESNSFDYLIGNLFTTLSVTWQNIERSIKGTPVRDNPQNHSSESGNVTDNSRNRDVRTDLQKRDVKDTHPTTKQPPPPKQPSSSSEDNPIATYSSPQRKNYKVVSTKRNEFISSLALREYGISNNTILDIIKRANPEIKDLNQISTGQKINLPPLDIGSMIVESSKGVYSIHLITLSTIDGVKNYISKFADDNSRISISPVTIAGSKPWFRITMGDFSSREEAINSAKEIRSGTQPFTFQLVLKSS